MSLRGKIGIYMRARSQARAMAAIKSNEALAKYTDVSTPSTGANASDYWALYSYIKKYKPKEILELGPGITTLIMAQACKENGMGRITAMEDIKKYFLATQATIPAELAPYIDLKLSPPREYRYGPFIGKAYSEIPERPYEFVYIDGPNYESESEFDADIIEIVKRSKTPLTAYLDSRTGSGFIYHLLFGKKFKFSYINRIGKLERVSAEDLRPYTKVVASAMKRRAFPRWLNLV